MRTCSEEAAGRLGRRHGAPIPTNEHVRVVSGSGAGWARPGLRPLGLGALGTAIVEVSARVAPHLLAPGGMLLAARDPAGARRLGPGSSWPQAVTAYWEGKVAPLGYNTWSSTRQLSPPGW